MTARDVIAERRDQLAELLTRIGWTARNDAQWDNLLAAMSEIATLAQPSGEAVAHEVDEAALEVAVEAGRAAIAPTRGPAPGFAQMRAGIRAYMAAYTTPPAPLGGLTEDALVEWACKEMHGTWDFPEAHSEGGKATLRDRMRRIIERARLTAPRAEGVDETTLRSVADMLYVAANNPVSHGGERGLREVMFRQADRLRAALTAAAPKVDGDWLDEMVDRRAPEVRAKMEQRVNELRAEAAAPQRPDNGDTK